MQFDIPDLTQTIIAVSSPIGAGRSSIVRLSGKNACDFGTHLFGKVFKKYINEEARIIGIENVDFEDLRGIEALIILMKAPKSYTKEDVLELHLPACQPLVENIIQQALARDIRMAAPGEFTLRAFINGRINSYQVESISRIIESRNIVEAKASSARINSEIINELYEIEDSLIRVATRLELSIDFEEDEQDEIDFVTLKQALQQNKTALEIILEKTKASIISNLPIVAIAGAVNVGKSTLFNFLSTKDAAIISAHEKTTRDFIISEISINKTKASLVDTAGYFDEAQSNEIDIASKEKAVQIVKSAAIILWCAEDFSGIEKGKALLAALQVDKSRIILCLTKSDLHEDANELTRNSNNDFITISAKTGLNIELLKQKLAQKLESEYAGDYISVSAREKSVLIKARQGLDDLLSTEISYENLDTFTEDLKTVLRNVGKMTGTSLEAETLSYLFSDFCIGK